MSILTNMQAVDFELNADFSDLSEFALNDVLGDTSGHDTLDGKGSSGVKVPVSHIANLPVSQKGLTGNVYIDGILWGGNYWNSSSSPKIIDYSFWNSGTASFDDPYDNIAINPSNWTSAERVSMVNALNTWSAVANIKFVNSGDNKANATLGFYNLDNPQMTFEWGSPLGIFSPPSEPGKGIGYFNNKGMGWNSTGGMSQGSYGFITLIHELGHGLGLAHPHDNGGGLSIYPGVTTPEGLGNYGLNQGVYTTMSYNDGLAYSGGNPGTNAYGYQGTPMAFDIAAIQYLYGANNSYRTGNNTYFLPTTNQAGNLSKPATMYSCIWDAGGIDKISGEGALSDVTINLNDATLNAADGSGAGGYISSAKGIYGGFTIANKVTIENADGSFGNDTIVGNSANNILYGEDGSDDLYGDEGNDTLKGGRGSDQLDGGKGNDTLSGGAGTDVLTGGGNNDTLTGNQGADTFNFYSPNWGLDIITDFSSAGDTIQVDRDNFGDDLQAGAITAKQFCLGASAKDAQDRFIYNQSTGALFFDSDGTGSGAKIWFATLAKEALITRFDIVVV